MSISEAGIAHGSAVSYQLTKLAFKHIARKCTLEALLMMFKVN